RRRGRASSAERMSQLANRVGHEPVVRPGPTSARLDEPRITQHPQVVGDRGLGELERSGEIADATLLRRGEPVDDRHARRVGDRTEACGERLARSWGERLGGGTATEDRQDLHRYISI